MGCLIDVIYTKKASEKPSLFFLMKYKTAFKGANILWAKDVEGRYTVRIYLQGGENYVSKICRELLEPEPRIDKVRMIS